MSLWREIRRDGGQIIPGLCENVSAVDFETEFKISINYFRNYQNDQLKKIFLFAFVLRSRI